jgi:hypothetical protein
MDLSVVRCQLSVVRRLQLTTDNGQLTIGTIMPTIPLSSPDITQREIDAVLEVLHTADAVDRAQGGRV